jgi:hypothetical protein
MPESTETSIAGVLGKTPVGVLLGFAVFVVGAVAFAMGVTHSTIFGTPPQAIVDPTSIILLTVIGLIVALFGLFIALRNLPPRMSDSGKLTRPSGTSDTPQNTGQLEAAANLFDKLFSRKFPVSLDDDVDGTELWLIGVTLETTMKYQARRIQAVINRGGIVRILTIDPNGEAIAMVGRSGTIKNLNTMKALIRDALKHFCQLRSSNHEGVEIRTIDHPLSHSVIGIDPNLPSGALYIAYYPFKTTGGANPKFVIHKADGEWYSFFTEEMQLLWKEGVPWQCNQ